MTQESFEIDILAQDTFGNTGKLNTSFFVKVVSDFTSIEVGNTWQYAHSYTSACYGTYGGTMEVSTISVRIISKEERSDSILFSFEEKDSGIVIQCRLSSIDTSDVFEVDTVKCC